MRGTRSNKITLWKTLSAAGNNCELYAIYDLKMMSEYVVVGEYKILHVNMNGVRLIISPTARDLAPFE